MPTWTPFDPPHRWQGTAGEDDPYEIETFYLKRIPGVAAGADAPSYEIRASVFASGEHLLSVDGRAQTEAEIGRVEERIVAEVIRRLQENAWERGQIYRLGRP